MDGGTKNEKKVERMEEWGGGTEAGIQERKKGIYGIM